MGDRAIVIFKTVDKETKEHEYSPVVYLHWRGEKVPKLLADLAELMASRRGDLQYACARFIGICHEEIEGNLSLGCWSLSNKDKGMLLDSEAEFMKDYSHGDAGVFIVDCADFSWVQGGGYVPDVLAKSA